MTPAERRLAWNIAVSGRSDTGSHRRVAALLAVSVFDRLAEHISGSPLTYGVVFAVTAVDAFFPLVPSETAVITAGTLAASGDLLIFAIIPAAAAGAFVGDNVSYALGAGFGERAARKLFTTEKGRGRLDRAQKLLYRHGAAIIVLARFVPGGRTATTFAAGTLDLTWRRFAVYDLIAATVWGVFAGMIGYLGGATFREDLWKALALGFGLALLITGALEGARRVQARRGRHLF
jgi:membrane-associated protein